MQVWYTNSTSFMMPPAIHWFPHYYWQPIIDLQPVTLDTVVVGNRVFTNGEEEVIAYISLGVGRTLERKHSLIR